MAGNLEKLSFEVTLRMSLFKVEWYPIYGPKSLFKFGEKRPIVCYCTHEQKMNFEGFTQNGCYGNQPQPFEPYLLLTNSSFILILSDLHRGCLIWVKFVEIPKQNFESQLMSFTCT